MKKLLLLMVALVAAAAVYGQNALAEGDRLFDEGRYDEAKAKYTLWKAASNERLDYADRRIGQCDECVRILAIADYLFSEKDYVKAKENYDKLLAINPKDPVAKSRLPMATIEKVWVDYNVVENGQKGMKIHLVFSVSNMLNQTGRVGAYFYNSNDAKLMDTNQSYRSADGQICVGNDYTPGYLNTKYSDFTLFIPWNEIHLSEGKHDLKFHVTIFDATQKPIVRSSWYTFRYSTNSSLYPLN